MKKIINELDNMVVEMGMGMAKAYPDILKFSNKYKIISRNQMRNDKVILISGGGSGHEPAHGGFVGSGMLDMAVCGDVFASPSSVQIYNAIKNANSSKGVLLIIKNYSGDIMNFETAAEMAQDDDIVVDKVFVNDDIAVEDSLFTVGRRGVAGTLFVHKIAGAAAESGLELAKVKEIAQKAISNVSSIGIALTSCTVPAKGTPTFQIGEDEMEYGVGIHGEPGIAREKMSSAKNLAGKMCDRLLEEMKLEKGDEVVVMINGLGATPLAELFVLNNDVSNFLMNKEIIIYKTMVGNYMTAIDMAGVSITLLKLDDELKKYFDAPADTAAWKV